MGANGMSGASYQRVVDPAVWASAEIGGKAGLTRSLSAAELTAIDRFLARTEGRQAESLTAQDFEEPSLAALAGEVRRQIMDGRGAVVVSGVDIDRVGYEGFKRIYWVIGAHIGTGVEQSYRRDKIGLVQKEENNPTGRGYLQDVELRSHTDFHEVLSLASVRKSASGGTSGIVSSLAIHNIILDERPDLLAPLYEGYYHESAGGVVSTEKVPIFGTAQGKMSCYYHPLFMTRAAKLRGEELPPEFTKAKDFMRDVAARPEVRADFMLEPGEMMFWHNFTQLHSREAFNDTPEAKRLLLRLWINVKNGRPMPNVFHECARWMDEAHSGGQAAIDYIAEPA
jgi:hypothetical protein